MTVISGIFPGETNLWYFSADAGDNLIVAMGTVGSTNLWRPSIRLFGPDDELLALSSSILATEVSVRGTNSGPFRVECSSGSLDTGGEYRLTLAKTGEPVSVSPGDEGGRLTNGVRNVCALGIGDLDVWTVDAGAGDTLIARMAPIGATNTLISRLRLFDSSGLLVASSSRTVAEVSVFATTNDGAFLLVADNSTISADGSPYQLTLARSGEPVTVSVGDEGGTMTNGRLQEGFIDPGDLDVWSFRAEAAGAILVRVGETIAGSSLAPSLRVYGPTGAPVGSSSGNQAAEIGFQANEAGVFVVVVGDDSTSRTGSGSYVLNFAETADPIVISPGDEGGTLTNGLTVEGLIGRGDLDLWTFTALAGDDILLRVGESSISALVPWIRLFGPNGALLGQQSRDMGGQVAVYATNSGSFAVVVADGNSSLGGSGPYRLTLIKSGSSFAVEKTRSLTNGILHTGSLDLGAIDLWSFSANAGDNIVLRLGKFSPGDPLTPAMRVYGPDHAQVDGGAGSAVEAYFRATNSGLFTAIVMDGDGLQTGAYRVNSVNLGGPILVSPGDEGGPMTNGVMHVGIIETGDLDAWTFYADTGQALVMRIGEILSSSLTPALRLFGPDGAELAASMGSSAAEIGLVVTNSGAFTVLVGDGIVHFGGTGQYRLTLAKTATSIVTSPDDEGGLMTGKEFYEGYIALGDLDLWAFTSFTGDPISLQIEAFPGGETLIPWLRLYGPDGGLLGTVLSNTPPTLTMPAPTSGTYIAVVGDGSENLSGIGPYRLITDGLYAGIRIRSVGSNGQIVLDGVGGGSGRLFSVITATNISTPLLLWSLVFSDNFGRFGEFSFTNAVDLADPQSFFRIVTP